MSRDPREYTPDFQILQQALGGPLFVDALERAQKITPRPGNDLLLACAIRLISEHAYSQIEAVKFARNTWREQAETAQARVKELEAKAPQPPSAKVLLDSLVEVLGAERAARVFAIVTEKAWNALYMKHGRIPNLEVGDPWDDGSEKGQNGGGV